MAAPKREEEIHEVFDITLVLKGAHALIETIGGLLLYAVSAASIIHVATFFVQGEIREDPHDIVANYFLHMAETLGGSSKSFAAIYLLGHGIINGAIVIALWKEKMWAYPVSLVVLGAFIAYQMYLLTLGFSLWLTAFTILDIVIVILVWHEYGVMKKKNFSI
ncbi:MAG TPA: DUF2127 domain-containing protein [Candidatus Paceibacterota bacterium]